MRWGGKTNQSCLEYLLIRVVWFISTSTTLALCGTGWWSGGEWTNFVNFITAYAIGHEIISLVDLLAWLFATENGEATNFFRSFAKWCGGRGSNTTKSTK
jgi:hypothetical protein